MDYERTKQGNEMRALLNDALTFHADGVPDLAYEAAKALVAKLRGAAILTTDASDDPL